MYVLINIVEFPFFVKQKFATECKFTLDLFRTGSEFNEEMQEVWSTSRF